jgi:hypothetical protein
VRVLIKMINTLGVEGAGAADDTVDFVALLQEKLSEVGTILAGDAGDEGFFAHKGYYRLSLELA